jgi:hypothetical protein
MSIILHAIGEVASGPQQVASSSARPEIVTIGLETEARVGSGS